MAEKVEFTKEQLAELTEYFKQNDFTKNMMLEREYNPNLEESKVFIFCLVKSFNNTPKINVVYRKNFH